MDSAAARLWAVIKDACLYLLALWEQWIIALTGGLIIGGLTLWDRAVGKPLSPETNWLIVAATFIVASFMAWRKEMQAKGAAILEAQTAKNLSDDRTSKDEKLRAISAIVAELDAHRRKNPAPDIYGWLKEWHRIRGSGREKASAVCGSHKADLIFAHQGQYDRNLENWGSDHLDAINEINWLISSLREYTATL